MHFSIDRTVHTTAFDKPVVDHWLERKITYVEVPWLWRGQGNCPACPLLNPALNRTMNRRSTTQLHLAPYRTEGTVLFNDALNTFYLRLYGVRHMIEDHSDSDRGNPLPPHMLLFPINSKVFYMHHPTGRINIPLSLLHQSWSTGWNVLLTELQLDISPYFHTWCGSKM